MDNPNVSNILIQDVCAGRLVDHLSIGTTDRVAFELALDAISNPGPANFERAGGAALCGQLSPLPDTSIPPDALLELPTLAPMSMANGAPEFHWATEEPPLKPYAQ